jgi:hypothetical protein
MAARAFFTNSIRLIGGCEMYVLNVREDIKIMPAIEYIGFASLIFSKFFATFSDY